jgi:gamma-glutamylcyclotransferase (GGCT)/AIG2-like uncharacterized protein YtfP
MVFNENTENNRHIGDHLFVYGTLQSGQSRNHILADLEYEKAFLIGYRKISPPQLGFPFIVEDDSAKVNGEIYFSLSQSHWIQVDMIEGDLYRRILVKVRTDSSQEYLASVYYPTNVLLDVYMG